MSTPRCLSNAQRALGRGGAEQRLARGRALHLPDIKHAAEFNQLCSEPSDFTHSSCIRPASPPPSPHLPLMHFRVCHGSVL